MLRDEYIDHVAALVCASIGRDYDPDHEDRTPSQLARDALAVATALADLRYPVATAPASAEGECGRYPDGHAGECNGHPRKGCRP